MKKILAALVVASAFASVAMAAETYSQNAVGFINLPAMKAGELVCLTIPFAHVGSGAEGDEALDIADLQFATDAPAYSYIYTWGADGWEEHQKYSAKGEAWDWDEDEDVDGPLPGPGDAIFFKPSEDMDSVILAGQVPADGTCPIVLDAESTMNMSVYGNPYPVPVALSNSTIGTIAPIYSKFYRWSNEEGWVESQKYAATGEPFEDEDPDEDVFVIEPGMGIFFDVRGIGGNYEWDEAKPYTWP